MIGRHGIDCPKVTHIGGGYLHADDDDSPYDVDGIWYCGRCHAWMGIAEPIEKRPRQRTAFQRYVDEELK